MSLQSVEAKLLAAKELVRQTLITITKAQKELQTQYYALQTEIDNLHSETQSASIQTQSAPVQTQSASIQTQPAPVQTQSAPVQTQSAPIQSQSASVQTQSVTPQPVTPQPVTPQPVTPPPQPVTPQPKPELPKLLLIKRCGAMFLYQDMNGVIVAKKDLLPQPEGIKPVPESVSELNPLHFITEYGTEGATKILERYTLEQLQKVGTGDKYVIKQDIQGLSKEKLINLLVRTAERRLHQGETLIKNG